MERTVPRVWSATVGLAALVYYAAVTPAVSGDKDSAEFALVLAFNGVAHPTGYPLFTLLGHLWTILVHRLGATWAYAANSWSALGGAVAIYLLHRLGGALVPPTAPLDRQWRFLLALLPPAFLALDPIWTYDATLAEVYSWHVAWGLGAVLYFVHLVTGLAEPGRWSPGRLHAHAALWGVVCGLGGAHHSTSVLVAVPLSLALIVVLVRRRLMRATLPLAALLAALVPLASYGIIHWRATHPAVVQWPGLASGLQGLVDHVTGRHYLPNLGRFAPAPEQVWMLERYLWPVLVPGLLLLVAAALRARGLAARTIAVSVATVALGATVSPLHYGVVDPSSYFLLPLALALTGVIPPAASLLGGGPAGRRAAHAGLAVLGVTAAGLWIPWSRVNAERVALYARFDDHLGRMWGSITVDSGFVFWANDMTYKLRERQLLRGERRGLMVYHPLFVIADVPRARFIARHGIDPGAALDDRDRRALVPGMPDSLVDRLVGQVVRHVNHLSPLPVVHFDARRNTVRLLRKPGDPARPSEDPGRAARPAAETASGHPR